MLHQLAIGIIYVIPLMTVSWAKTMVGNGSSHRSDPGRSQLKVSGNTIIWNDTLMITPSQTMRVTKRVVFLGCADKTHVES